MEPGCSVLKLNFSPKLYLSLYISYGLITVITITLPLLCNAYANTSFASIPDNPGRASQPQSWLYMFILIYIFPLILKFPFSILLRSQIKLQNFKAYIPLSPSLCFKLNRWNKYSHIHINAYLLSWEHQLWLHSSLSSSYTSFPPSPNLICNH